MEGGQMARKESYQPRDENPHQGASTSFGLATKERDETDSPDLWPWTSIAEQALWSPQVESFRRGDKLVIRADLPGLSKDDVKVEIENGMLTISGEREDQHTEDRDNYYRTERSYGRFFRAVALPDGADADKCEATFKNGMLEVTIPAPSGKMKKSKQVPIR
jgi:HSP20 family molecular chaperone IbpA